MVALKAIRVNLIEALSSTNGAMFNTSTSSALGAPLIPGVRTEGVLRKEAPQRIGNPRKEMNLEAVPTQGIRVES